MGEAQEFNEVIGPHLSSREFVENKRHDGAGNVGY